MTQPSPTSDVLADHLFAVLRRGLALLLLLLPLWLVPWAALPFEPTKVALLRISAALLLLTAGLGAGISASFRRSSWERLRRSWLVVVAGLGYGAILTFAGVTSSAPDQSLWGLSDGHGIVTLWAQIALFLLVVVIESEDGDRAKMIRWLLLGSVPVTLYGLVQAGGWDPLAWQSDSVSPILSTLGRSNFLGAYLALLLPFSIAQALSAQSTLRVDARRIGLWSLVGLHSLCLLLTLARAGWLAAVAGVLVFFWLSPMLKRWARFFYRGALLVGALLALFVFFSLGELVGKSQLSARTDGPAAQLDRNSYSELRETSLARRWIIWQASWKLVAERPLLGYGPEMFVTAFNERYPPGSLYAGTDVLVDDPHNQLLEHLVASGLMGAGAWLALLAVIARRGVARQTREKGRAHLLTAACLGSLVAWLVQSQLNPDVVVVSTIFWVVAGLVTTDHPFRQSHSLAHIWKSKGWR